MVFGKSSIRLHCSLLIIDSIPGGSEDVMLDLAVRQLLKIYQTKSKLLAKPNASKM
jgi:hypothetical protein